jgi:hypothetical protein
MRPARIFANFSNCVRGPWFVWKLNRRTTRTDKDDESTPVEGDYTVITTMRRILLAGAPTGRWTNLGDEAILAGMAASLRAA